MQQPVSHLVNPYNVAWKITKPLIGTAGILLLRPPNVMSIPMSHTIQPASLVGLALYPVAPAQEVGGKPS